MIDRLDGIARLHREIDAEASRAARASGGARSRGDKPMIDRLDGIARRHREIDAEMSRPEVASDHAQLTKLAREQRALRDTVQTYEAYKRAQQEVDSARELQKHERDAEMQEYLKGEEHRAAAQVAELDEKLKVLLLPKVPNDDRDVVVEIQGAEGGEEAALFAGDLFRMYTKWAERKGWKVDVVEESPTEKGGFDKVVFEVHGHGAYSQLKFEDIEIKPSTSQGPGGQSVNTTYSAIRITHKPTGMQVSIQDEKSQLQNKEKALRVLRARLYEIKLAEQQAKIGAQRRGMVGTGSRSEKVRTYNFKENRVTDHRIKVTLHRLDSVMNGDLDELVAALVNAERAALLNGDGASKETE